MPVEIEYPLEEGGPYEGFAVDKNQFVTVRVSLGSRENSDGTNEFWAVRICFRPYTQNQTSRGHIPEIRNEDDEPVDQNFEECIIGRFKAEKEAMAFTYKLCMSKKNDFFFNEYDHSGGKIKQISNLQYEDEEYEEYEEDIGSSEYPWQKECEWPYEGFIADERGFVQIRRRSEEHDEPLYKGYPEDDDDAYMCWVIKLGFCQHAKEQNKYDYYIPEIRSKKGRLINQDMQEYRNIGRFRTKEEANFFVHKLWMAAKDDSFFFNEHDGEKV